MTVEQMTVDAEEGLDELFNHERILCRLGTDNKTVVLKRLATLLRDSGLVQQSESDIISSFVHRERLGSTVVNAVNRVAVPHVRLDNITRPCAALITLKRNIPFDDDDRAVRIVLGLALPRTVHGSRLPLLDKIHRFFADEQRCTLICTADSGREAMNLIRDFNSVQFTPAVG